MHSLLIEGEVLTLVKRFLLLLLLHLLSQPLALLLLLSALALLLGLVLTVEEGATGDVGALIRVLVEYGLTGSLHIC